LDLELLLVLALLAQALPLPLPLPLPLLLPLLLPLAAAAAAAAAEAAEPKAPNSASKVYLFLVGCELRKKVGLFESCRSRFEKKNIQTVEMCDKSIS
jgi:hypothetical protein